MFREYDVEEARLATAAMAAIILAQRDWFPRFNWPYHRLDDSILFHLIGIHMDTLLSYWRTLGLAEWTNDGRYYLLPSPRWAVEELRRLGLSQKEVEFIGEQLTSIM